MSSPLPFRILGLGRFVPERVVPSEELEALWGLEPGWIASKTGVKERRWTSEGEDAITMAAHACRAAVEDAGLTLADIDALIWASGAPSQAIPDGGHLVQQALGLGSSGRPTCLAVHATCLSFLTGLDVAAAFLNSGRYQRILVVSSDRASGGFDTTDPRSAVLFGDAAAAAVVALPGPGEDSAILHSAFESYGDDADLARIRGWGTARPPLDPGTTDKDNVFFMDGPGLFLSATQRGHSFTRQFYAHLPEGSDIPLIVPHQPSLLVVKAMKREGIPEEKVVVTLDRFGNCVAASIPLTLHEAVTTGRLKRGQLFFMLGFGAGLCLGGMLLRY